MIFADVSNHNEFDTAMTNVNASGNNIHARSRTNSMNMDHYNAHGPKKPRSGSISGRLRTATDLEETGLIDKTQKGIIKDLIISGDPEIHQALDTYYEKGDTRNLQNMISDGYLRRRSVDLLDGLDLDFLNVDQDQVNRFSMSSNNEMLFDLDDLTGGGNMGISYFDNNNNNTTTTSNQQQTSKRKPSISISNTYTSINNASNNIAGSFGLPLDGDLNFDSYDILSRKFSIDDTLINTPFDDYLGSFPPLVFSGENKIDISHYTNLARSLQKGEGKKSGIGFGFEKKKKSIKKEYNNDNNNTCHQKSNRKANNAQSQSGAFDNSNIFGTVGNIANTNISINVNTSTNRYDAVNDVYVLRNRSNAEGGPTVHSHFAVPGDARGYIGAYSPEGRKARIERFVEKRNRRVWTKKVKYDVRKNFADSRIRVKGRFVKKEDEELIKDLQDI